MALLTVDEIKEQLRVEHTADDTHIVVLRTLALGLIQAFIGRPIVAVERTFADRADSQVYNGGGPRSLIVPETPIDPASIAITDKDGTVVDTDDLAVDAETGIIRFTDGDRFPFGPYAITVDVGLSALSRYADEIEPVVNAALLDTVADFYQRRSPGATSESSAGVSRSYTTEDIPPRTRGTLLLLRGTL